MGYPTPPQGWEMVTGTWGTDANRESVIATSGGYSLRMDDTAVATKLRSGWIAVEGNIYYNVWALVRTDDITAGYIPRIRIEEYGADKSTLVYTTNVVGRLPTAVDTWEWMGATWVPNGAARWARITIEKTASAYNVYWDKVHLEKIQPGFTFYRNSTQSIPDSTWTAVTFTGSLHGGATGSWFRALLSSGAAVLPIGGQYSFSSTVLFDDPSANANYRIRLKHNVPSTITDYYYGNSSESENGMYVTLPSTHVMAYGAQLSETFEIEVYQDSGGAVNIIAADISGPRHFYNCFSGHRINPI